MLLFGWFKKPHFIIPSFAKKPTSSIKISKPLNYSGIIFPVAKVMVVEIYKIHQMTTSDNIFFLSVKSVMVRLSEQHQKEKEKKKLTPNYSSLPFPSCLLPSFFSSFSHPLFSCLPFSPWNAWFSYLILNTWFLIQPITTNTEANHWNSATLSMEFEYFDPLPRLELYCPLPISVISFRSFRFYL